MLSLWRCRLTRRGLACGHLTSRPVRADLRSLRTDERMVLVAQRQVNFDDPEADDLYRAAQAGSVVPVDAGPAFHAMPV